MLSTVSSFFNLETEVERGQVTFPGPPSKWQDRNWNRSLRFLPSKPTQDKGILTLLLLFHKERAKQSYYLHKEIAKTCLPLQSSHSAWAQSFPYPSLLSTEHMLLSHGPLETSCDRLLTRTLTNSSWKARHLRRNHLDPSIWWTQVIRWGEWQKLSTYVPTGFTAE